MQKKNVIRQRPHMIGRALEIEKIEETLFYS